MRVAGGKGKGILLGIAFAGLAAILGGCQTGKASGASVNENFIGTEREGEQDRLVITITCDAKIDHFAAAVEERFPDIRLVQDSYLGGMASEEHQARVKHKDLGDLVMFKAGRIPEMDFSGQLMDLSSHTIPSSYSVNALQMDQQGHIYLIPGPLNFNCNIYNKTLFEEHGWKVPEDYEGFLELCQTIDQSGIRGCRYVYQGATMQTFNFCARSGLDTLTQVEGQTWHNALLAGDDVSLDPLETAFRDLDRMMEAGIVRAEDLEFTSDMRNESLSSRQIAIGAAEINTLRKLCKEGPDEFRFMPHFSMTDGQGWLMNLGYYYGANEQLKQPGNEKKLEAAMKILTFLATEEGQDRLIEDNLGMVPAIRGASIPDDPLLESILPEIESGRYIVRPVYNMFRPVLETEIAAYIQGKNTSEAILEQCRMMLAGEAISEEAVGSADADFTILQTAMLKADALRAAADADVALIGMAEADNYVPVAGNRTKLYKGDITETDLLRIAQIQSNEPLYGSRAELTGEELMAVLEYGAFSIDERESGAVSHFHPYAVSGLNLTYNLGKEMGSRVTNVKTDGGASLDPKAVYRVAFLEGALPQDVCDAAESTGISLKDALEQYVRAGETIAPDTERIRFR